MANTPPSTTFVHPPLSHEFYPSQHSTTNGKIKFIFFFLTRYIIIIIYINLYIYIYIL